MLDAPAKTPPPSPSASSPSSSPAAQAASAKPVSDTPASDTNTTANVDASERPRGPDVVLLGPRTADGGGVHVLRARQERIEIGELRPLAEGRPIAGEVLTLAPREGNPRVCDVKESFAPRLPQKGPAKVSSKAYREGWDDIFGSETTTDRQSN